MNIVFVDGANEKPSQGIQVLLAEKQVKETVQLDCDRLVLLLAVILAAASCCN